MGEEAAMLAEAGGVTTCPSAEGETAVTLAGGDDDVESSAKGDGSGSDVSGTLTRADACRDGDKGDDGEEECGAGPGADSAGGEGGLTEVAAAGPRLGEMVASSSSESILVTAEDDRITSTSS